LAHIPGKTERIFVITDTLYLDKEVPVRFWNPSGSHPDPESGYRFWIRTGFTPAEVSKNVVMNRARITDIVLYIIRYVIKSSQDKNYDVVR